ncbi:lysine--tRNA ligase [Collinsella stercoris]|uniref:Lysine--tRNA ligase n=1 Tax=Collinsella stercoris DSM 13279 TaxID=445975 RepID=B6GB09_9ACTN|nr:lysine--tRNA ligase [Collinsella stercoris]EEA90503.1 lysine--tRNA ligase [Collinsella stercoris DSM 13279]UEA45607.1 lysine--tRNA ligase [Collinsella stercoris DSM 13279]UWP11869.1 lysine--tRNA ligase [Collinsella stercoris]
MAENLEVNEAANTLNDERARRLADRAALYEAGKNPYPEHSSVTDHAADLLVRYEGLANEEFASETVTVGGRVVAKRGQGKIMFLVLRDPSADIQLFCRVNDVEEESWATLKKLDLGDIIQATGVVTRTKRGELSVAPRELKLLSKAVRPLPEKFHGLSDKETRYRQRYVDLIVNEDVRETFRKRSAIISTFRRYMEDDGYMEVETPILQSIQGGATAKPFITHFNALNQENYLRIATELHLKRLLVGGYERVFEIGRIFRNEGMDLTHNPEFTTMEAYRAYSDLEGMKELAEGVIKAAATAVGLEGIIEYQGQQIDLFSPWASRSMTEIVSDVLGREVTLDTPVEELFAACAERGIETKPEWTAGKLIAEIYDELGEDTIVNPTFVCDYPVEVSPLAKRNEEDPRLTHRFELVIAGHEYANAFSELNDPVDQAERFAAQMAEKAGGDDEAMEYDEDYVRALEYGMPPAGGIGIGIDRVVMLLTNSTSIRDVLLFPHMKPEKGSKSGAAAAKAAQDSAAAGAASPFVTPAKPTLDYSKVVVEPLFEDFVDFDTFAKSDFRAVKVKDCVAVPKSKKLLNFTLDDGTGTDRTILSGIHDYYEPEDLVGKTLIAITNLPPRKMMGIPSCGMIISAVHAEAEGDETPERLNVLIVDDSIPAGAKLY